MRETNYQEHNRQVRQLWEEYRKGIPHRVPVTVGISSRFAVHSPELNPEGSTMEEYCRDPDVMFRLQLRLSEFLRFRVDADHEMGTPEEGWGIAVDFQNYYEAAWYGCPVEFPRNGMPTTSPILTDDRKAALFVKGIPDPFSGIMGEGKRFLERFEELSRGYELRGAKVTSISNGAGLWMDGPFTLACELRGLERFCIDIYEDPEYAEQLLSYLTEAAITRIKAWRKYHGMPEKAMEYGFADDSITVLSADMVRELLVPHYRKILRELCADGAQVGMHLCGDAGRLFPILQEELHLDWFDTGFPLDHGKLARELKNRAYFNGGPHIGLLLGGTPQAIEEETKRILREVMPVTRKFTLRDGNDIAPGTPMKNIDAMVRTGRTYGVY